MNWKGYTSCYLIIWTIVHELEAIQATPCQPCLEALSVKHSSKLVFIRRCDVDSGDEEELRRSEEVWSRKVVDLQKTQKVIPNELKRAMFEMKATMAEARETIAKAQDILEACHLKYEQIAQQQNELVLRQGQLQQLADMCTMIMEKARIQATQQFSINDDKLYRHALNSIEETWQQVLKQPQAKLKTVWEP